MLEESATRIRVQGCEGVGTVGWWGDKNHWEGGEEGKKEKNEREGVVQGSEK